MGNPGDGGNGSLRQSPDLQGIVLSAVGGQPGEPDHETFLGAALDEARKGLAAGGIPIGSVIVVDGEIVGRGHNQRVQKNSVVLHAEMAALENGGRLSPAEYRRATIYTTLSPCSMCSGAILLYRIPQVVIGENRTFLGAEDWLESKGVELIVMNHSGCIEIMSRFIETRPALWNEDIGEIGPDQ